MTAAHVLGHFNARRSRNVPLPTTTNSLVEPVDLFRVEADAPGTRALAGTNLCDGELAGNLWSRMDWRDGSISRETHIG